MTTLKESTFNCRILSSQNEFGGFPDPGMFKRKTLKLRNTLEQIDNFKTLEKHLQFFSTDKLIP